MSDKCTLEIDAESQRISSSGEAETYFIDSKITALPSSRANLIVQIIAPEVMALFRLPTSELRRMAREGMERLERELP